MNNKMRFCLMLSVFFMNGLSCSDVNSNVQKFIAAGYLDEVYERNERCKAQVYVIKVTAANEQEKNEKFKTVMADYVAQVAKKYPTAPKGFDFKSYVHADLLNLGDDQAGLLIQHAHPGHRVQIVVAKKAPEVQSKKSAILMILVPLAMFGAGIINSSNSK